MLWSGCCRQVSWKQELCLSYGETQEVAIHARDLISSASQSPQYAERVRLTCQALGVHREFGMIFGGNSFKLLTGEANVRQKALCNALDKNPSKMSSQECVPLRDWPHVSRLTRVGLHLGPLARGA